MIRSSCDFRDFLMLTRVAAVLVGLGLPVTAAAQQPVSLTQADQRCQAATNDATVAYLKASFNARHDCFLQQLRGELPLAPVVDCRAPVETGTGDDTTDQRLLTGQSKLLADVTSSCVDANLTDLGFPGFCPHEDGEPYGIFEHEECLRTAADTTVAALVDVEQPAILAAFSENADSTCQDTVSRQSSNMFVAELQSRAACVLSVLKGRLNPELVDCRLEQSTFEPMTGHGATDDLVVGAHNKLIRVVPSSCPRIDLVPLGFPNQCPAPSGTAYPLAALSECMFNTHHFAVYRMLDLTNPLTTKCGNDDLDFAEQCDDGNTDYNLGEVCRGNCSLIGQCADTNDDGVVSAADALFVLRAAVGSVSCQLEICDANHDGSITATDVLMVLQHAVGLNVVLACPLPLVACGNGLVDPPAEACDDGDRNWAFGEACNASCQWVACGDPNDSGTVTVADARFLLRAALGLEFCDLSVGDVDSNGRVDTTDALRLLSYTTHTGQVQLACPAPVAAF